MVKKIIEKFKKDPVLFLFDLACMGLMVYLLLISIIVVFMMLLGVRW